MTRRPVILAALATVAATASLAAQGPVNVRVAALYESYAFDSGLVFDRVTELTVPVVVALRLARVLEVTVSGGYVRTELRTADTIQLKDQSLEGPIDTEFRIGLDVIPGRLVLIGTGAIPSGRKTVELPQLTVLGALASDIIGFTAANMGSGGNVGGGFAGAFPVGRWAVGLGATYRQSLEYQPILDRPDTLLRPGADLRVRAGLEGPLARRTYLRLAGIYGVRQKDQVSGQTRHGVGNRIIGYLSVNQGLGRSSISLYAFDVFRSDPQIETTAVGAAFLPRGNLLAAGGALTLRLGDRTSFAPQVEYRSSALAADTSDTTLRRAGESIRFGGELRQDFSDAASIVFQGSGASGKVVRTGAGDVGFGGFRAGVILELRP